MLTEEFKKRTAWAISSIDERDISRIANTLAETDGTVYIIGNGGSAANAEHAANDFLKVAHLKSVALTAVAPLTAYANDDGYELSFCNPLRVVLRPFDTLLAVSVSGTSRNIANALAFAQTVDGVRAILLMGDPDKCSDAGKGACIVVSVEDDDFGVVETVHQAILHMIANKIKEMRDAFAVSG